MLFLVCFFLLLLWQIKIFKTYLQIQHGEHVLHVKYNICKNICFTCSQRILTRILLLVALQF